SVADATCHFSSCGCAIHLVLHFFPTRRSSDLISAYEERMSKAWTGDKYYTIDGVSYVKWVGDGSDEHPEEEYIWKVNKPYAESEDRKSTRLNSSHVSISYAVCCLKKNRSSW